MFLFIVYGVGPRHCQNVGCSKSTAKAQLWDTPSVKLTDVKVGNPVHLLPCCHLPLSPWLWAPVALPLAQHSPAVAPSPRNASHLTHISLPGGELSSAPQSHGSRVLRISQEQAVHLRKWAKTLSWLNSPPDSSLSPRISLQQQFSLCTSTSWLQTVLRSITKHNPKSSSVLTLGKVTS